MFGRADAYPQQLRVPSTKSSLTIWLTRHVLVLLLNGKLRLAQSSASSMSTTGGVGTVLGILAGVLIFGVINYGLPFIGVNPYWQEIVTGLIIVVAHGWPRCAPFAYPCWLQ